MTLTLFFALVAGAIGLAIAVLVRVVFFRRVEQGKALVVSRDARPPTVSFTGAVVYPILHHVEVMDVTSKTIRVAREVLEFRDGVRAEVEALFYLRVIHTQEDVLKVAQTLGCARASDLSALEAHFAPVFASALQTVAAKLAYDRVRDDPEVFVDGVVEHVGSDLDGFILEQVVVERLGPRPASGYRS